MLLATLALLSAQQASPGILPDRLTPGRGNPDIDVEHYALRLELDPPDPVLRAEARIRVRLRKAQRRLRLDLHAGLAVDTARLLGNEPRALAWSQEGRDLILDLGSRRRPGETIELAVRYGGDLPQDHSFGEPVGLLHDGTGIVSYLECDGAHQVFPCNDHPSDKATFTVDLVVPRGQFAAATGLPYAHEVLEDGRRRFGWRTEVPTATYLLSIAAGRYQPIWRNLDPLSLLRGEVPILDLAWHEDAEPIRERLAVVEEMIPFLEARFGPYPFERYGHAFLDRPIGGLENQTMTVLGRDLGLMAPESLLMHELAHQWFGDWVSPQSWSDLWLNEGWATYCEMLWAEARRDPSRRPSMLHTWNRTVEAMARRPRSPWLSRPTREDLFGPLVYIKGGRVLALLEDYLGREVFFEAARSFLGRHGGSVASTDDFQAALESSSGVGLDEFFAAWVHSNALPRWEAEWGAHNTRLELRPAPGAVFTPFATEVEFLGRGDRRLRRSIRWSDPAQAWEFELPFEPVGARLDPDGLLPRGRE